MIRLKPGKRAWPYHAHYVIEEMFYILEGEGTLRHAGKEYPIRAGDFICSPADPEQPHQIINTSDKSLTYIALGT
ncbi:MAG: cupin domain-containing protein, partial [Burkholderiales bacterium]|nr:cupin domain-containing protein [Burkholderiales bacterium]